MASYTTAVQDEDVLRHFKEVLVPFVYDNQNPQNAEAFLSPGSRRSSETVLKEVESLLLQVTKEENQEKVNNFIFIRGFKGS